MIALMNEVKEVIVPYDMMRCSCPSPGEYFQLFHRKAGCKHDSLFFVGEQYFR